jgi:hypothetical protein
MRVLINYGTYADRVTIHCLADGARTVIAPFKRVSSLETLYLLIAHVGGDPEQCRMEIKSVVQHAKLGLIEISEWVRYFGVRLRLSLAAW